MLVPPERRCATLKKAEQQLLMRKQIQSAFRCRYWDSNFKIRILQSFAYCLSPAAFCAMHNTKRTIGDSQRGRVGNGNEISSVSLEEITALAHSASLKGNIKESKKG